MKVDIETFNKKMEDQQRKHEEEMKQLREEFKKKEAEVPPVKKGPCIVKITDENCHKLSPLYPGMLINEDGSLTRTPMSETWSRYTTYQLE